MASIDEIKELRQRTGLSIVQIKEALDESKGDKEAALAVLKARGASIAAKKSDRTLGAGVISSYIHNTKANGTMLELNCETDFVAKNEEFIALAHDIAMHISAMSPESVDELLKQDFVKDPDTTILALVEGAIQKFGEKIEISRFERYSVLS